MGEIDLAVAAVEDELGGTQEFFEITASPQDVRLFVAVERRTAAAGYVYLDGGLAPLGDPRNAEGFTFNAGAIDFDPDTVLDQVADAAPDALVSTFSIIGTETGPVRYGAFADSVRGGRLDITLAGDGEVLGVGPAS